MAKVHPEKTVLSYFDSLLRTSDVALLEGCHWLNDVIIGFYFEYLDKKFNKNGKRELYFCSPPFTQLLKVTDPSHYSIYLDAVNVSEYKCLIFPLNDCNRKDAADGLHWSLLVYSKLEKTCYHFDSCKGFNRSTASEFARNIMNYLHPQDKCNKNFIEKDCEQQDNGYDCGVYVLCVTDIIAEYVMSHGKVDGCDCSQTKKLVCTKRKELLDLIDTLKQE